MNLFIDGDNVTHGAYYGGGAANAPGYIVRRIGRLMVKYGVTNVVVAWDDRPSFRKDLFPRYKEGRKRPADMDDVIAATQDQIAQDGYRNVFAERCEADDVLATLALRALLADEKSIMYSSDKDLHQMLYRGRISQLLKYKIPAAGAEGIASWRTHDGKHGLLEEYGVSPEQWIDYRCLTGDSSDSIPGFKNIGPVAARGILSNWGTIDAYFADPEAYEMPDKIRTLMDQGRKNLELWRQLVTLRTRVKIDSLQKSEVSEKLAPF